jgi:hypothetical protein
MLEDGAGERRLVIGVVCHVVAKALTPSRSFPSPRVKGPEPEEVSHRPAARALFPLDKGLFFGTN